MRSFRSLIVPPKAPLGLRFVCLPKPNPNSPVLQSVDDRSPLLTTPQKRMYAVREGPFVDVSVPFAFRNVNYGHRGITRFLSGGDFREAIPSASFLETIPSPMDTINNTTRTVLGSHSCKVVTKPSPSFHHSTPVHFSQTNQSSPTKTRY